MKWVITKVRTFFGEEEGVTAIEYALIASLIAIVIIGAVTGVGSVLIGMYKDVANSFP